jgi:vanillate O-demethylase ferredoxin subunit
MEAVDACGLELRGLDGAPLPPFTAGAHIDVVLPGGLTRQYSLCNAPHEPCNAPREALNAPLGAGNAPQHADRYEICVLRAQDSRGGSRAVHEDLAVGQDIEISAPRNLFALAPGDAPAILIAGGIGITPILSMALVLSAQGRPFEVHYASRSMRHAAFSKTLKSRLGQRVHLYTPERGGSRLDLDMLVSGHAARGHFYVCGPRRLIDATLTAAQAAGVAPDRVHVEHFAPAAAATAAAPAASDADFELFLARSLRTVAVGKSESIIQAIRRAGVDIVTSCEQGVCGTCVQPVLEGEVEHLDYYLSEDEKQGGQLIIPCCSRARSQRLVLDL